MAIDWHDIMYYGDPEANGVMGTQPKKGTRWAYEFGSISTAAGGPGLTLAATPITKGYGRVEHVRRLLDAGYYSAGIKFIMRMPDSGAISAGRDFLYTANTDTVQIRFESFI